MEKKNFYKAFFAMYVVLVLQNVISLSVNLADNLMLGSYSETALSGVAAVNQIQFVYQQLLVAIGDGLVILCSQYWGKKQTEAMRKIAATAMRTALTVAVVMFVLVSLFPEKAMGFFTTDAAIAEQGMLYMGTIRHTYIFFAVTMILLASMRSVETVNIAFYLSVSTLIINCCMNYTLIFGHFGAPELGVTGAAIGTLTARIVECAAMIFYVWKKDKKLNLCLRDYLHRAPILSRDFFRVSLPIRLQKMFLVIGIISGTLLYFIRIPILSLYDLSPETREMANAFLIILSVVCMTMSYQMPVNNGLIRGGGNPMFVVKMDLISIWGIVIPLSFIMAFVVKASPIVVVCCLNLDQVFKCIPAFLEVNFGHWARKLTRN